jgi:hypothetical protein
MSAYEILISAEQREYITTALVQCQLQAYFGADKSGRDEIDMLVRMFTDLPPADSDDNFHVDPVTGKRRHITHGFCL